MQMQTVIVSADWGPVVASVWYYVSKLSRFAWHAARSALSELLRILWHTSTGKNPYFFVSFHPLSLMVVLCRYAYIEIALYGKSYIQSAKDTWRLFQDRGRGLPNIIRISRFFWHYTDRHRCSCQRFAGWNEYGIINIVRLWILISLILALVWGAYAVGMLCSLFGYLYLRCKHPRHLQCPTNFWNTFW